MKKYNRHYTIKNTKSQARLGRVGHRAKKSMGQNFLKSKQAIRDILNAGEVNEKDLILEIGPGKGILTEALLNTGAKVLAIEKDRDLIPILEEKFKEEMRNKKLILLNEDVLELDHTKLKIPSKAWTNYKLIANIPYNITGAIFEKFLTMENKPERMVMLVQKEVAQRIVARDGKESILSLSVKAYGKPKYIAKVPAKYFSPAPKVDSAILAVFEISGRNFKNRQEEAQFFKLIKAGFAHKRKLLSKNLSSFVPKLTLENVGIPVNARAEDLSSEKWFEINKKML